MQTKTKIILAALTALTIILAASQADTKIYIGNENDQFIVGIESLAAATDAAAGLEIRTYFAKQGLMINGREYGALPGKTVYAATAGGKSNSGGYLKYKHTWTYNLLDAPNKTSPENTLELGYGIGPKILTH